MNAAHATTVNALVIQTLEACRVFAADAQYSEYASNIARKAAALQANPSAKAAYTVLSDLRHIAQAVGTWNA